MKLEITCPDWLTEEIAEQRTGPPLIAPSEQMAWVLALARRNVESETGGPFAAAVFELESGKLVAAGVNRVVPAQTSIAHAETLALSLAQQYLGTLSLLLPISYEKAVKMSLTSTKNKAAWSTMLMLARFFSTKLLISLPPYSNP